MKKRQPRPSYHHGDLRRVLLDASVEVLAERGTEAMSLRDVARRAGVSPAAPYHHFASKEALLDAIAHDGFFELARVMNEAGASVKNDPIARIRAIGEAYIRFALDRPAHFHLMFRRTGDPRAHDDDIGGAFQVLLDAATDVVGVEGIGDRLAQRELVVLAWSVVHGAANLLLDGPLTRGIPSLGIEADAVPKMAVKTLETLILSLAGRKKR